MKQEIEDVNINRIDIKESNLKLTHLCDADDKGLRLLTH